MNKDRIKNHNKKPHAIEIINKNHNPISSENSSAVLQNTPDDLGYAYGLNTTTEPNPFPFTEEESQFGLDGQ